MTCIVGVIAGADVYMGADSAGTDDGFNLQVRADRKVFAEGPMLIGGCGSFRMIQLLHHKFVPPAHFPTVDIMQYMVGDFIEAVRRVFRDGGFITIQNNTEEIDGAFLVGYQGRLFTVQADLQVGEVVDGYAAIGIGEPYALGALAAIETSRRKPVDRILVALNAASRYSGAVCPPYHIMRLKGNGDTLVVPQKPKRK